ncbi:peptide chain release factor N(5)-glutamine methyltransferase [Salinicola halophilus]|uniref:peptide chain release factor N(5)-glutamine methyltransferase n=1 Tax=Salinicola halophilus TaxID=184065 RepID=UPI000DA24C4C|nr:peptide chain release factor N(5)-glutamine methyltransferase [Salinicola halophilus]
MPETRPPLTVDEALRRASGRLTESDSARLDAELLLMHVLGVGRTWLYTWGDRPLDADAQDRFDALLARREAGWPVAYLVGRREFWGLELDTTAATLIPRPDTERLVEAALASAPRQAGALLDLGTGTGAVALAFACERPGWRVSAVDDSADAVALAAANAERLGLEVEVMISDWFSALAGRRFDVIVSNPPYIADDDPHLTRGDVRFEPRSALVADADGFAALETLVIGARTHLNVGGWLWLEHGFEQGATLRRRLEHHGYRDVATFEDLGGRERVTGGRWDGEPQKR